MRRLEGSTVEVSRSSMRVPIPQPWNSSDEEDGERVVALALYAQCSDQGSALDPVGLEEAGIFARCLSRLPGSGERFRRSPAGCARDRTFG